MIQKKIRYEGAISSEETLFSSLKHEKERKGNVSNKSILFIITLVYWYNG